MDLRLVATHPDRLGGMRFILTPLRGFTLLAFALGTIAAGTIAEAIIVDARLPIEFRYFIGAQVLAVLVAFAGPLLLLSLPLVRLQERGTVEWGQAASRLGREFQKRWTEPGHREMNADALGVPDFSATVDLFGIVAGVQNINPLVLDVRPVLLLVLATLLPYVPVVFAVMPFDQVMQLASKASCGSPARSRRLCRAGRRTRHRRQRADAPLRHPRIAIQRPAVVHRIEAAASASPTSVANSTGPFSAGSLRVRSRPSIDRVLPMRPAMSTIAWSSPAARASRYGACRSVTTRCSIAACARKAAGTTARLASERGEAPPAARVAAGDRHGRPRP